MNQLAESGVAMGNSNRKRGNGDGSVYKRGDRYWISWFDENGLRKCCSAKTTERRLAERLLQSKVDRVIKIKAGLIDLVAEKLAESSRRLVDELARIYGSKLRAEGRTEPYAKRTEREIREFAQDMGIDTIGEINAEKAVAYLERLRLAGWAARTMQCRITSVKSLTRWAWREGMLATDPLAGLKRPNPETDRRLQRRMLTIEEWHWLESATLNAPSRFGLSGHERAMLYTIALQTGLRAGELQTLTKSSLHLSGDHPFVRVEAGGTKNRKPAKQYLRPRLADQLRKHAARMAPGAKVFKIPRWDLAEMLCKDLADARAAWIRAAVHDSEEALRRRESDFLIKKNSDGHTIDFHALRHTCGAWAAIGGASPKAIQTLMRHSTIVLTLDTYGHMLPDEAAETVGRMPGFDQAESQAATGTLNSESECSSNVRNRSTIGGDDLRESAAECDYLGTNPVIATVGDATTWCDEMRPDASSCLNSPARIRTGDRAIMSRQL